MTDLYLFQSTVIAFLLTLDLYVLARPLIAPKKYPVLFFTYTAVFFLMMQLALSPLLLAALGLNALLTIKFTGKLYSALYVPLSYLISCIFINISGFANHLIFGLGVQEQNRNIPVSLFSAVCAAAASLPVFLLVRRCFQKHLIRIFEQLDRKMLALIALTLFICTFMMYTMASFFDTLEITRREYFLMAASILLYFLFTASMILFVLYTAKKSYEAQKKAEYLENLNEYTKNLETVYDSLRSFRHDYTNIMTAFAAYIDEKKYDELESFFHEHILPMQRDLTQKNSALNDLMRIRQLELKSILYTKLLLAVNKNIEVNIDIPDEIDSIHMDPVDLTRILGIYLDNALEACLETERPAISVHLGKMGNDTVIIIANTFVDHGLTIARMKKKEVTTKGSGHGIGLSNVSAILNRYPNIYHETSMKNELFVQQLQIAE